MTHLHRLALQRHEPAFFSELIDGLRTPLRTHVEAGTLPAALPEEPVNSRTEGPSPSSRESDPPAPPGAGAGSSSEPGTPGLASSGGGFPVSSGLSSSRFPGWSSFSVSSGSEASREPAGEPAGHGSDASRGFRTGDFAFEPGTTRREATPGKMSFASEPRFAPSSSGEDESSGGRDEFFGAGWNPPATDLRPGPRKVDADSLDREAGRREWIERRF